MILEEELCGYCGACVSVCPLNLLQLSEFKIHKKDGCSFCQKCVMVCPLGAVKGELNDEI